ncbi:Paired box domain-containing protein [Spironucleus salmonicida]|uniref:Paired box domain-containing protein n=1 Tax=Spironucleus salmonicida TaxID=348837 RepID=V6LHZ9_9EUKA|nr:Paired box domain-containing protein [Spironucleus salmonicida]|eukprot:EST43336.1 Paired box domain-containing protein [Spironucleus salmonicida]
MTSTGTQYSSFSTPKTPVPNSMRLAIIELYKERVAIIDIAKFTQRSQSTISSIISIYLNENRILSKGRGGRNKRLSAGQIQMVQKLHKNGMSIRKISTYLRISYGIQLGKTQIGTLVKREVNEVCVQFDFDQEFVDFNEQIGSFQQLD